MDPTAQGWRILLRQARDMDINAICLVILVYIGILLDTSASSESGDEKSTSTVVVVVEGKTMTVQCSPFFTDVQSFGPPSNDSDMFFLKWTAPRKVTLRQPSKIVFYARSNISLSAEQEPKKEASAKSERSEVESTAEGDLIFHSPTKSFGGQYECHSISLKGETLGVHYVYIRVIRESHFDTTSRTVIGLVSGLAVLLGLLICCCLYRHCKNRRKEQKYSKAKTQEILNVPTITILDVHGQKVEEDII